MMSFRLTSLKLTLSILGLIIYLFIFGSVTYAWVTMSQINNIDNLTLIASMGQELLISTDGKTYSTSLSIHDLQLSHQLKDVTSLDGKTFQRGGFHDLGDDVSNEDYISFDLYFKSTAREHDLFLVNRTFDESERGTKVESQGVSFIPKVHYTEENHTLIEKDSRITYYAKDALRISFGELDDNNQLGEAVIYDPSENEDRGYGKPFGAYSYYIARTNASLPLPIEHPNTIYQLSMMDPYNPYQALDNLSLMGELKPTNTYDLNGNMIYQTKIRFHLWIEGWDPDAIDGILEDTLSIQLEFKLAHRAR